MSLRCSVFIATSLDGFIAREDGSLDWLPGADGQGDGEDYGFNAFYASVDTLVMGRKTYDFAAQLPEWPYAGKRVVVLSSRYAREPQPFRPEALGSSLAPVDLVRWLAAQGAQHAYIDGGQTIRAFLRAGLIQDITLTRVPVLLGAGISLFAGLEQEIALQHEGTQAWPSGLVQSRYRVRG